MPRYFPIWQSKERSHEFVCRQSVAVKPVSATGATYYGSFDYDYVRNNPPPPTQQTQDV